MAISKMKTLYLIEQGKGRYSYSLFTLSLLLTFPSIAREYYPDEFADFFNKTTQQVDVSINGLNSGVTLEATVNFDEFSLPAKSESLLQHYLTQTGLKPELIQQILADTKQGVRSDSSCKSRLVDCRPLADAGAVKYVYDFDNQIVKLFVAPDGFIKQGRKKEYQSPYNPHPAFINNSWLNLGYNHLNTKSLTWSNDSTLGLPLGYLSLNTQFSAYRNGGTTSDFELYEAIYNAEYRDVRLQAGRTDYNLSFNSTDYLSNGMSLDGDLIGIGRSQNLLKGEVSRQQQYEYYAPQNGILSIYRGTELILSKVVNEGLQTISYFDLPKGVYSARFELEVAGRVIQSELVQIVNNNQYVLPLGEWDYVAMIGRFDQANYSSYQQGQDYDRKFARAAVNYRLTEALFLGAGFVTDRKDQYWQLGSSVYLGDKFNLDYSGGFFTSGEEQHIVTMIYSPFSFSYRKFNAKPNNNQYRLSQQLFSDSSYQDLSLSVSGTLLGVQGYLRHSYYETQTANTLNEYKQNLTTLGASHPFLTGNLSINANYTTYRSAKDQFSLSLSWTKNLGDFFSVQTTNYFNNDGFNQSFNSLNYSISDDNYALSTSAGIEYTKDNDIASVSGTYSKNNRYANFSSYGYANDLGNRSISANLSSTQIVTPHSFSLTNEQGRAFANIKIDKMQEAKLDTHIYANVKKDTGYSHRVKLTAPDTIMSLTEYTDAAVSLDEGTNNIELGNKRFEDFVKPGSLLTLNSELNQLVSHVVVFDDILENPIGDLTCIGDGCVNIEPLSDDGVYRVSYRNNKPVRFLSSKGLCIFDQGSTENYSYGFCLPSVQEGGPRWVNFDDIQSDVIDNQVPSQQAPNLIMPSQQGTGENLSFNHQAANDENSIFYLGRFIEGKSSDGVNKELNSNNINFKRFEIGSLHYYYIFKAASLNTAQKVLLQKIDAYAQNLQINDEELLGYHAPNRLNQQTR